MLDFRFISFFSAPPYTIGTKNYLSSPGFFITFSHNSNFIINDSFLNRAKVNNNSSFLINILSFR